MRNTNTQRHTPKYTLQLIQLSEKRCPVVLTSFFLALIFGLIRLQDVDAVPSEKSLCVNKFNGHLGRACCPHPASNNV